MNFYSDNVSAIAPAILDALLHANHGSVLPNGADPITSSLRRRFSDVFEADTDVFLVTTGTAANALGLAAMTPPWGGVLCHESSHLHTDECGATEFFTAGAKLLLLPGDAGKVRPQGVERVMREAGIGQEARVQPTVLSLTQATELGTVYSIVEVQALSEVARRHDLLVHMDGARFANALAYLACTPAEATWKAGVDVLSFGATKNGTAGVDAVIFFRRSLAAGVQYRRKRAGQVVSKMRFLSAQMIAYLHDGLWLRLAANANAMAERLANGLATLPGLAVRHPVQANEVFVGLSPVCIEALKHDGIQYYQWSDTLARFVTSWSTTTEEVDHLLNVLASVQPGSAAHSAHATPA